MAENWPVSNKERRLMYCSLLSIIGPICTVHAWLHEYLWSASPNCPRPKKDQFFDRLSRPWVRTQFFFAGAISVDGLTIGSIPFNTLQLEETCRKLSMADAHFFGEVHQLNIPVCNYAHPCQEQNVTFGKKTSPWFGWPALLNRRFS